MSPRRIERGSLADLRRELEGVDRALVVLMARRLKTARRAIRVRTARDPRLTDPVQERVVLQRSRKWAREFGVGEALVESLFRTLLEEGKAGFRTTPGPEGSPRLGAALGRRRAGAGGLQRPPRAKLLQVPGSG